MEKVNRECKGCKKPMSVYFRKSKTKEWCSKKCWGVHHKLHIKNRNFFTAIKRKHNIAEEEYKVMASDGCNICGIKTDMTIGQGPINMPLDHCHTTGKVRGVLCSNCNRALGHFKDNINYLKNAYLAREPRKG